MLLDKSEEIVLNTDRTGHSQINHMCCRIQTKCNLILFYKISNDIEYCILYVVVAIPIDFILAAGNSLNVYTMYFHFKFSSFRKRNMPQFHE